MRCKRGVGVCGSACNEPCLAPKTEAKSKQEVAKSETCAAVPEAVDSGPNGLMTIAWRDFVCFAFSQDEFRRAFEKATKTTPLPNIRTPLDAMIDKATGIVGEYAKGFTRWVTKEHWGTEGVPPGIWEDEACPG